MWTQKLLSQRLIVCGYVFRRLRVTTRQIILQLHFHEHQCLQAKTKIKSNKYTVQRGATWWRVQHTRVSSDGNSKIITVLGSDVSHLRSTMPNHLEIFTGKFIKAIQLLRIRSGTPPPTKRSTKLASVHPQPTHFYGTRFNTKLSEVWKKCRRSQAKSQPSFVSPFTKIEAIPTRSNAQENPPSMVTNLSWPCGGSPRRARMFWIPLDLTLSSAPSSVSTSMLVQVRCIMVSTQICAKIPTHIEFASRPRNTGPITTTTNYHHVQDGVPKLTMFCILLAMSRVTAEVDPPAPQVMSQNAGWCMTMRSIRSNRFSTPSSVFGGKNSKENTTLPPARPLLILSMTFMAAEHPSLPGSATQAQRHKNQNPNATLNPQV